MWSTPLRVVARHRGRVVLAAGVGDFLRHQQVARAARLEPRDLPPLGRHARDQPHEQLAHARDKKVKARNAL